MDRVASIFLQVIAVACIYLVISISFSSAIEISIYRQILRGSTATATGEKETINIDAGILVDRKFEVVHDPTDYKWDNVQVKIEVIGKDPQYPVKKIYLFKCKDTNPLDCVDYEPVVAESYLSGEKGTFYWRDVSRNKNANFLTMVKFSHDGQDFWIGYWEEASRAGVENFNHRVYDVSRLDLYGKPGIEPAWIKDFISRFYMIPGNWMDRAVLGTINGQQTSEIYQIVADKYQMETPYFEKYKPATSTIDKVTKDYMLAFGKGSISNPITFFSNPLPNCGDGTCSVSENPSNCCLDCGCAAAGQECTTNAEHPSGMCHTCGDGVSDPVENSTTCCVDAGCPAGLYCNAAMNMPYGKCVNAACGNSVCEPSEDSRNCPADCWGTPGKRCSDAYGPGYYYNQQTKECVLPECGQRSCEPGEDNVNCCADCGCPTGQYCNTDRVAAGTCMSANCGNSNCEPGETYANCCTDCGNCPADPYTGQLQVCSQNMCHLCGNGHIESPVETPQTCCQDTGCIDGYCSVSGGCKAETEVGMRVKMLPETVDCVQGGEVDLRFTFANGPAFFNSFESIAYNYKNSRYRLTQCVQQGDIYTCKLPLNGPETFAGCFEPGTKNVVFTILFTYFEDAAGKKANDMKYKEVSVPFSFDVTKARLRACNKNGACEPGTGETPESCCWDCMCEGGLVCTASGCNNETVITLAVNPEDLPNRNNIDCNPRNGMQPTGSFQFKSHVQNVPESAYETFSVLNWKLEYNNKTYTAQNIPGFACSALTSEMGRHTGDVECSVPVSMFPACPNPPPADMKLTLNVLGGGLTGHYAPYEGKPVSAAFSLDYVQGLPLCGNGEPNPELGETINNCCRDMGCPSGKVCTVYTGCVDQSQVDLTVSVDPSTVDCSREPMQQRGQKKVIILAEVTNKPYSPSTGGVEFGDAYIDDSRIEEMGGMCEPVVNSTVYSVYAWRCAIPVTNFNPFCWKAGRYNANFETTIAWQDRDGNRITKSVVKPITFSVGIPRERQCVPDGFQDPELGEILDQCCPDAGCSGDKVCTKDITCVSSSQISLVVDDVSPDALDCSVKDQQNMVTVTAHVDNMPYHMQFIEWFMEYNKNTFTEQYFTCNPVTYGTGINTTAQSNTYKCEMPVYYFPACAKEGIHSLKLKARVTYGDYRGRVTQTEASDDFNVRVGTAGLPNCGNGMCDKSLGETTSNCCQDCGCASKNDVCTVEGRCYTESNITMRLEPAALTTECQLAPWDMDTYKIISYQCIFQNQLKLMAHLNHKPWQANIISASYAWDKSGSRAGVGYQPGGSASGGANTTVGDFISPGEEIADGWNLYVVPNPSGDYKVPSFSGNLKVTQHTISDVTLTLQLPARTEEFSRQFEKVAVVRSLNDVKLTVNEKKNEDLLDLEKALKDAKDAMDKAKRTICSIVSILAICAMCSLIAGGVADKAAEYNAQQAVDKKANDAFTPDELKQYNSLKKEYGGDSITLDEYSTIDNKMANLQTQTTSINSEIGGLEGQRTTLESQLTALRNSQATPEQISSVTDQIGNVNSRIAAKQGTLNDLNFGMTDLKDRKIELAPVGDYLRLDSKRNQQFLALGKPKLVDAWKAGAKPDQIAQWNQLGTAPGAPTNQQAMDEGRKIMMQDEKNKALNSMNAVPQQGKSGAILGMFSTLASATTALGQWGGLIVGGLAGIGFMWIQSSMLGCEGMFNGAIAAALGVCGSLAIFGGGWGANFLVSLSKICDLLSLALTMLMQIMELQNTVMEYQGCVTAAESGLSQRPRQGETAVDRSRRIADYYRQLSACHKGLEAAASESMNKWANWAQDLATATGQSTASVQATPPFGSTIGPGSGSVMIKYNFPSYRQATGYGSFTVTFNYMWRTSTGLPIGGSSVAQGFSLSKSAGTLNCFVRPSGLQCQGEGEAANLETQQMCENYVASRSTTYWGGYSGVTTPQEICKDAELTGTITFKWQPCNTDCSGYYQFSSKYAGGTTTPGGTAGTAAGATTTTQAIANQMNCCWYNINGTSGCYNELGYSEDRCKNVLLGTFVSGAVCNSGKTGCDNVGNYCQQKKDCNACTTPDSKLGGGACTWCGTNYANGKWEGSCKLSCTGGEKEFKKPEECTKGCQSTADCQHLNTPDGTKDYVCSNGVCINCYADNNNVQRTCDNCLSQTNGLCQWDFGASTIAPDADRNAIGTCVNVGKYVPSRSDGSKRATTNRDECFKQCTVDRDCAASTDQLKIWACHENRCKKCDGYTDCLTCITYPWCMWETPQSSPQLLGDSTSFCVGKGWSKIADKTYILSGQTCQVFVKIENAPVIQSVINTPGTPGKANSGTITVRWNSVPGATGYEVFLKWDNTEFKDTDSFYAEVKDGTQSIAMPNVPDLTNGAAGYKIKVRGYKQAVAGGQKTYGPFSDLYELKLGAAAGQPVTPGQPGATLPNLKVVISADKQTIGPGGTITVKCTVSIAGGTVDDQIAVWLKNEKASDSTQKVEYLEKFANKNNLEVSWFINPLDSTSIPLGETGKRKLTCTVDPQNKIAESSNDDNTNSMDIGVTLCGNGQLDAGEVCDVSSSTTLLPVFLLIQPQDNIKHMFWETTNSGKWGLRKVLYDSNIRVSNAGNVMNVQFGSYAESWTVEELKDGAVCSDLTGKLDDCVESESYQFSNSNSEWGWGLEYGFCSTDCQAYYPLVVCGDVDWWYGRSAAGFWFYPKITAKGIEKTKIQLGSLDKDAQGNLCDDSAQCGININRNLISTAIPHVIVNSC